MEERRFEITEQMMREAKSYLPLNAKEQIVHAALPGCVKRIFDYDSELDGGNGAYLTDADDLPTTMPMYGEDTAYKSRVMMGVVLYFYLGIDVGEFLSITPEEYDRYGEAHVMNQIERFKASAEFKSKAFDMLSDIRDMEKRLNCAIYSFLQMKNDVAGRVMRAIGVMMSQDALEGVIGKAKEAQDTLEAEQARQDAFIESIGNEDGEGA